MVPVPLVDALTDLVLPRSCVGCGWPGQAWCAGCRRTEVVRADAGGLPVLAAGEYTGALRAALIAYKERGRRDLARPLGELLARAVRRPEPVVLVPVPSAPGVARARGGDHVARLARIAGRCAGARVATSLHLGRPVSDSAGLNRSDRARNLHQAMVAGPPPRAHRTAVIVDDIVTTGATLREASRALEAAGWAVCAGAVVAATARRPSGTSCATGLT
jgi:predicted amidophosphoribosyltransferase